MPQPIAGNGTDYYGAFLNALNNLSGEFSRKLDESERDTKKQFDTFSDRIGNQFQAITNKFESAMATRDAKLEAVSTKLLEGKQAPWALLLTGISVAVLIMGAIGGLAYAPISQRTNNIERAMEKMVDNQNMMREFVTSNFVSQKDLDARTQRGAEDRDRTNRAIESIQANIFTREVHTQHWNNIDAAIAATNLRIDSARQDLQRQLDAIQKAQGDTFTARDALLENKERISKLEDMIRQLSPSRGVGP